MKTVAFLAGAFFMAVNYVGAKETGRLQNVIVIVLVAILAVFTVPLYPATPILGAIASFALIVFIEPMVIAIGAALVGAAILWYFGYARSRTEAIGELSEFILSRRERMPGAAVSAASSVKPDGGDYRVMVPLANPEHEEDLMTLASAVARHHGGVVDAVHVVTVPDQTSLEYAADHLKGHEADYCAIIDKAQAVAPETAAGLTARSCFVARRSGV